TGRTEISKKDREQLDKLYIRSERQEGYLHKHNGADMVSVSSPAYTKVAEELKTRIAEKYAGKKLKKSVDMKIRLRAGEEALLTACCGETSVSVSGEAVQKARKAPLAGEEIVNRLKKTGDTSFEAADIECDIDEDIFMPVSALNELRRSALAALESRLLERFMRTVEDEDISVNKQAFQDTDKESYISVSVFTAEQALAVPGNIKADRLILPAELFSDKELIGKVEESGLKLYMRMPEIVRQKDLKYISGLLEEHAGSAYGISVNSIDGLCLAGKYFKPERIHADAGLYAMNDVSADMLLKECGDISLCSEQNGKEYEEAAFRDRAELNIYGRAPVMISANCVLKNTEGCDTARNSTYLNDDSGRRFPVLLMHKMCYNIVLNCVPTSLHREFYALYSGREYAGFGLNFMQESGSETIAVLKYFERLRKGSDEECPYEFTRGHFRRGAE
ncbi:MAG: DUF3656 domain-containing protein, partial [Lachnospiraceae bacterium]|nr:DUF3656 domain-containing protein [Lachnospiraceae bacterium]